MLFITFFFQLLCNVKQKWGIIGFFLAKIWYCILNLTMKDKCDIIGFPPLPHIWHIILYLHYIFRLSIITNIIIYNGILFYMCIQNTQQWMRTWVEDFWIDLWHSTSFVKTSSLNLKKEKKIIINLCKRYQKINLKIAE